MQGRTEEGNLATGNNEYLNYNERRVVRWNGAVYREGEPHCYMFSIKGFVDLTCVMTQARGLSQIKEGMLRTTAAGKWHRHEYCS